MFGREPTCRGGCRGKGRAEERGYLATGRFCWPYAWCYVMLDDELKAKDENRSIGREESGEVEGQEFEGVSSSALTVNADEIQGHVNPSRLRLNLGLISTIRLSIS